MKDQKFFKINDISWSQKVEKDKNKKQLLKRVEIRKRIIVFLAYTSHNQKNQQNNPQTSIILKLEGNLIYLKFYLKVWEKKSPPRQYLDSIQLQNIFKINPTVGKKNNNPLFLRDL